MVDKPTRALGEEEDKSGEDDGWEYLDTQWDCASRSGQWWSTRGETEGTYSCKLPSSER